MLIFEDHHDLFLLLHRFQHLPDNVRQALKQLLFHFHSFREYTFNYCSLATMQRKTETDFVVFADTV